MSFGENIWLNGPSNPETELIIETIAPLEFIAIANGETYSVAKEFFIVLESPSFMLLLLALCFNS